MSINGTKNLAPSILEQGLLEVHEVRCFQHLSREEVELLADLSCIDGQQLKRSRCFTCCCMSLYLHCTAVHCPFPSQTILVAILTMNYDVAPEPLGLARVQFIRISLGSSVWGFSFVMTMSTTHASSRPSSPTYGTIAGIVSQSQHH